MSDMSDTPREPPPSAIVVDRRVNARQLSRGTAAILREIGFEGRSIAIEHFGRVIGFLVPVEGRVPVKRGRKIVYEVPEQQPLGELNEVEASIVGTLHRLGNAVPDQLVGDHAIRDVLTAVGKLGYDPPLLRKTWFGYELTPEGERYAEELGL